jgi:hypothetical protein
LDVRCIAAGDIVGIGIHTGNALRGYEIGRLARKQGAFVVFGGVHATLYPEEAHKLGGAHLRNWELWNPTPSATLRAGCCAPNAQGWAPCFRVSAAQIPRRCAPRNDNY